MIFPRPSDKNEKKIRQKNENSVSKRYLIWYIWNFGENCYLATHSHCTHSLSHSHIHTHPHKHISLILTFHIMCVCAQLHVYARERESVCVSVSVCTLALAWVYLQKRGSACVCVRVCVCVCALMCTNFRNHISFIIKEENCPGQLLEKCQKNFQIDKNGHFDFLTSFDFRSRP